MKDDFENQYLRNANLAGTKLLEYFSSHLFNEIKLERYSLSFKDIERFKDNNAFRQFNNECKESIYKKYQKSIIFSDSFFYLGCLCFFVMVFNEVEYDVFQNNLLFKVKETCNVFLQDLRNNHGSNSSIFLAFDYTSSIIRKSTNTLFEHLSSDFSNSPSPMLFPYIEELSNLTYEKSKTDGLILFYKQEDIERLNFQFKFLTEIHFTKKNLKLIRKLLELSNTSKKIGIISDTNLIYGLAEINDSFINYSVCFYPNNEWELFKNNDFILCYKNFMPSFFETRKIITDFETTYNKVFGNILGSMKNISDCVKELLDIKKGTILVISTRAEELVNNYSDICIKIEPTKLSSNNIEKLSSIDGAIIINEKGICYGFGVILDGNDTTQGDVARGSRYNSSQRFFQSQKGSAKLLVFVLSDDGNYNIFPDEKNYDE